MRDSAKFIIGFAISMSLLISGLLLLVNDVIGVGAYVVMIVASIIVLVTPLLFFKGAKVGLDGTSLRIDAAMVNVDIPFTDIDSIRIYEKVSFDMRTFGFNGLYRRSGNFTNAEFGSYTCACDSRVPMFILITSGKKKILFNLKDIESTKMAFDTLRSNVPFDVDTEPYVMTEEERSEAKRRKKIIIAVSVVLGCILCAVIAFMMFTGSVDVTLTDSDVEVEASFSADFSIAYSDITSIELRKDMDYGKRVIGAANSKVLTGTFNNDEFGRYDLAVNKSVSECVVIHTADETYVINCRSSEATVEMYGELLTRITP